MSPKPEIPIASGDWAWDVLPHSEAPHADFRAPPSGHVVAACLKAPSPGPASAPSMLDARSLWPAGLGAASPYLRGPWSALFTACSLPAGLALLHLHHCSRLCGSGSMCSSTPLPFPGQQCLGVPLANLGNSNNGPNCYCSISSQPTSSFMTWDKPQPSSPSMKQGARLLAC